MALSSVSWAEEVLVMGLSGAVKARFEVEVARTNEQRARGLMFRQRLSDDEGMLFLYDDVRPRTFWMKDTYIPLDILFTHDGNVVHIAKGTPLDERGVSSQMPVDAVLEIRAGNAEHHAIEIGDKILIADK